MTFPLVGTLSAGEYVRVPQVGAVLSILVIVMPVEDIFPRESFTWMLTGPVTKMFLLFAGCHVVPLSKL